VSEFPIPSLRQFLLPDQLVKVMVFAAADLAELNQVVNAWVNETKAIVATVSAPAITDTGATLSLTYIPATGA